MKQAIFIILLLISYSVLAQEERVSRNLNIDRTRSQQSSIQNTDKPPITLYKIISVENDTTVVDTSLSIYKEYKFNYLRKDNFGLLKFPNVGSTYNRQTHSFINQQKVFPQFGARARHFNFMEVQDINYYHVPTPLTELFFKTVYEQGQTLDALFTINTSPKLNFSVAYKGLRSLGRYQHMLTSAGNFRTTFTYGRPQDRYRLKAHFVSQDLMNEENGGLDSLSLRQYIAKDPEFDDRSRLDVNYEDAQSTLFGKRFFLDHSYDLVKPEDTLSEAQLSLGHKLLHNYKKYEFQQASANDVIGESFEQSGLKDVTRLTSTYNEAYVSFLTGPLGRVTARAGYRHYDYGYNSVLRLNDEFIPNRLQGDIISAGGSYDSYFRQFSFNADGMLNLTGEFTGYNLKANLAWQPAKDIGFVASAGANDAAPNFNFLLNQSDYINYNWRKDFSNVSRQSLGFEAIAPRWLNASFEFTTVNNYAYFGLNEESMVKPFQHDGQVTFFKVLAQREFKWGKFALHNTVLYQNVLEGEQVFKVPDLITRNTLYFTDEWFRKALFLQTGFTLNYFTNYNMNGYDPVLSEFYVQNDVEVDGFPTVDFFFNGKIRQARVFVKLEHLNSLLDGNNNFAAPLYPYGDFALRFGLVWNFFM